ncbi:LapA family protein [Corynebacterium comes]|uniref:Lipopolysaccharide assembly protein A domain-containing protein n=1 Tax=Corynebacterium comes TaxID=2675218 RepID=A0A6B8W1V1_9CORY|nr:lipopolysaccharide assembly protein LapA domain-containing protein [Corynebacterium comes]QGU04896.1 hypothetical protein CETAM_08210 [Corynebacterium comes]
MTRSNSQYGDDPVYDTNPSVRNEPPAAHLDEHRDIYAEEHGTANLPATVTEPEHHKVKQEKVEKPKVRGSVASGTWAALIIGALLLIGLLVFILQNQQQVQLNLFAWTFQFPIGIGFLFAAITGALIMALVGAVRMLELRRQVRKTRKG